MYRLSQMDANNIIEIKDGDSTRPAEVDAPSVADVPKQKQEGTVNRKKRRRGKYKRKIMKPFIKMPWQDRRRNENNQRNNRFRKIVLAKTHAPFNNNQFLMEIHKPEPDNSFHIMPTPSARTRDSSFSVDSEDNYFFSLPEDEEEYLTKEFSSVYEDAQSERLSNMSKDDLIQEYLLLEAKYENLVKRTDRSKVKCTEEDKEMTVIDTNQDASCTDRDSMITDRDTSGTSTGSSAVDDQAYSDLLQRMKDQEEQINVLQLDVEKLRRENELLRQHSQESSSEDSESDSSSSTNSDSSGRSASIVDEPIAENGTLTNENININGTAEETEESETIHPMVNGSHDAND